MTNQNAAINMIKQQLRAGGVTDEKILDLYETLPRRAFIPKPMQDFAYSDLQIPLSHEQRMLTPLEEGQILQALQLKPHEVVLEIGSGTGFLTALLSKLCKKVLSIEYFQELTEAAGVHLQQHQCANVELVHGDASQGWLDEAPYDVVVITGAIDSLTETYRLHLLPGGRLFAILGVEPVMKAMLYSLDHEGRWTEKLLFNTCIPALINPVKAKEFVF